ncbi:MAG: cytochrome c3 family protein [Paracoccaceae bacterium]
MKNPSPYTHLYRLGLVGIAALVVFLVAAYVLSPASWNYDMSYWHREDALQLLQEQPLAYGGIESISVSERNVSCTTCHADTVKAFAKLKHKQLSCEDCHGALADHAQNGQKTADAPIDRSTWQCLNCHEGLVNKPRRFPVFRTTEKYVKHREFIAGEFPEGTTCLRCHDSHDPTP